MGTVQSLGRFQLITNSSPPALPGKCVVCGTTSMNSSYVDFGFDLDFYGVVYFCNSCIIEIARLLEFIPPETWQETNKLNDHLIQRNTELQLKVEELKNVVKYLGKFFDINSIGIDSNINISPENTEFKPEDTGAATSNPDSRYTVAEDGPTKQVDESGHTDVPDDDSDNFDDLISKI